MKRRQVRTMIRSEAVILAIFARRAARLDVLAAIAAQ
jgi:hypothetical protein